MCSKYFFLYLNSNVGLVRASTLLGTSQLLRNSLTSYDNFGHMSANSSLILNQRFRQSISCRGLEVCLDTPSKLPLFIANLIIFQKNKSSFHCKHFCSTWRSSLSDSWQGLPCQIWLKNKESRLSLDTKQVLYWYSA